MKRRSLLKTALFSPFATLFGCKTDEEPVYYSAELKETKSNVEITEEMIERIVKKTIDEFMNRPITISTSYVPDEGNIDIQKVNIPKNFDDLSVGNKKPDYQW